ncbi:hypothetical protein [Methylobacterium sp. WL9]|uniref:hypothetical protein n=1 Tax=Methylobacterium sp. WL9 TaxID=2603898 RepID=UPI0011C7D3D7|nr:hypothetical protein [Methylobacterium sp. WL9]TXN19769.1 hypothetical protein FV217_20260 [Methylobacterium sp. WL9]
MAFSGPYPLKTREAVEALLRESDLTMLAIAERIAVSYGTVKLWNREARIRPWTRAAKLGADPRTWTVSRIRAVGRLFGRPDIDPADLAEALGAPRGGAAALMLACGIAESKAPVPRPSVPRPPPPDETPDLAALLRAQIARQIAAFDDRLNGDDAADSARVLRDLGGLKRLLDDLDACTRQPESHGDADGASPQDLAALRDRIARRYEAFATERGHAGVPGASGRGGSGEAGA